jgi:molybdopterin molybdotransferase
MTNKDMLGRSCVVTREEALRRILEHAAVPSPAHESIPISSSLGRIVAVEVISPSELPAFARSTMDGYAVRSADTFGAGESLPALLNVIGDIPMGVIPDRAIEKGEIMKIATGGALPEGADAVVMLEHTHAVDERTIEITRPAGPIEHVVQPGDDLKKGEVILSRGHRMRPQDMAALASVGVTTIDVFARPKVAVISTGNELVPADASPAPGRIRDSNSYNLEGLILQSGGIPVRKGIISDDEDLLRTTVKDALKDCCLVLITGGSSVGAADHTAKVVESFGPPGVLVHGVSMRPGKPLIAGWAGTVPIFGLPGHPVAVAVSFEVFVRPVLARLTGEITLPVLEGISAYRVVHANLARSISSGPGREDHVRVFLEKRDGELWAVPVRGGSGLISTLVKAVGTVVVPLGTIGIEAGDEVEVRLF